MIVWINGAFGIGKTTTATALCRALPDAVLFDPELVGEALVPTFSERYPVRDFQDWSSWRRAVPAVLAAVYEQSKGLVVAPQAVLVEQYWDEITRALRGVPVFGIMLDLDQSHLIDRINRSDDALEWRLQRAAEYEEARGWMRAKSNLVVDAALPVETVTARIIDGIEIG